MDIMTLSRSLAVAAALLIASHPALAQQVTVPGRLQAQASSLVEKHYVQAYTIDSRPDHPLKSVQVTSTDFDAVLIAVAPDGTAQSDDDGAGNGNPRMKMAPRAGEWLIVVTAYELRRPGSFTLTVDSPPPRPTNRSLPRAAVELLAGDLATGARAVTRVDTVRVMKVDTVTVMRADTVYRTKVDTVTRIRPAPATRGSAPR